MFIDAAPLFFDAPLHSCWMFCFLSAILMGQKRFASIQLDRRKTSNEGDRLKSIGRLSVHVPLQLQEIRYTRTSCCLYDCTCTCKVQNVNKYLSCSYSNWGRFQDSSMVKLPEVFWETILGGRGVIWRLQADTVSRLPGVEISQATSAVNWTKFK